MGTLPGVTTIELVRHVEAESREAWRERPDHQRSLNDRGRHQADELARALLAAGPVDALYASPYERCTATLQPLAAVAGLSIHEEQALGEVATVPVLDGGDAWVTSAWLGGHALAFVDRVTTELAGRRLVACSHGDVIPALLAALAGRDGLDLPDVRLAKGSWVTLRFEAARCVASDRH